MNTCNHSVLETGVIEDGIVQRYLYIIIGTVDISFMIQVNRQRQQCFIFFHCQFYVSHCRYYQVLFFQIKISYQLVCSRKSHRHHGIAMRIGFLFIVDSIQYL